MGLVIPMKLLLDTHALLWAVTNDSSLSAQARDAIASENNVVFVSLASLWELQIKESIGKIKLPVNFYEELGPAGFELLPLLLEHIQQLRKLPMHHRDPFDRMLVAQAQCDQLLLVTRDEEIRKYGLSVLRA
jgi:PIN domain nuclease of toxin-antitoxin system